MRLPSLFLIILLAASAALPAQTKNFQSLINQFISDESSAPAPSAEEQLAWIKEQIGASQERLAQLKESNASPEAVAVMEDIVRNQMFSQTTLEGVIRLQNERATSGDAAVSKPPATQAELAKAKETAADLRSQLAATQTEANLVEQRLTDSASAIQNAEVAIAQAKDAPPDQKDLAELRLQAANTQMFLLKWQKYRGSLQNDADEMQLQQLERNIDVSRLDVQLDANRATESLAQVSSERASLEKKLADAQVQQKKLSEQLGKLEEQIKSGKATDNAEAQKKVLTVSLANASELALGYDRNLKLLDMEANHWDTVLKLAASNDPSLYQQARSLIQKDLNLMTQAKSALLQRFQDTTKLQNQLIDRKDPGWKDKTVRALLEQQLVIVKARVELMRTLIQRIEAIYSSQNKLVAEVEAHLLDQSFQEKVTVTVKDVWNWLVRAWNYPLFTNQGTVFTPGTLVIGIIALIVAFTLAGIISRGISGGVQRRFRTDPTKTVLIEKWVYYIALALLVLTVLNWLSIPLTVFAFLGGALAIGIGFGGQNLMNNFISGIILLFERRVNVGDIVEVDGHTGKVMHLGSRSSRIRKWDGVDVLVPNSYFLEKNVINWTLSDPNHRYDFVVGVAYGSPLQQCQQMFLKILADDPHVLKDPAPLVIFEAFGDSTLNFHFYYWLPVNVPHINIGMVGSEIRMKVDQVCREAGVEIAFPQRDVRLITDKPIQVTVRDGKKAVE